MYDEDKVNEKIEELEIEQINCMGNIRKHQKLANFIEALHWVNQYSNDDLKA